MRGWRCCAVWGAVTLIGTALAAFGQRPVTAIVVAQAVNGALLPLMAVFLLLVMNRSQLLGEDTNGWVANILGTLVVLTVSALGLLQLWTASGRLFMNG